MELIKTNKQELLSYTKGDFMSEKYVTIKHSHSSGVVEYDSFTFSGGEEHIRLLGGYPCNVTLKVKLVNSKAIMQLLMITDALRRANYTRIDLNVAYVPYARQDRVCNKGEALAIKVFCDLINAQGYSSVTVLDPHSDVAPALLNNSVVVSNSYWINKIEDKKWDVLVSPDAGALKKTTSLAGTLGISEMIQASKVRDLSTGDIVATEVNYGSVNIAGKDIAIVDDICDGGRTFIELAKVLDKEEPNSITLVVTHGIFSKGLNILMEYINHVYTTDSFCELESDEFVTVTSL